MRRLAALAGVGLAALGLALAPLALAGQEASDAGPASEPLSIERALELAYENNPGYLRQLNAVASAEYGKLQSLGQFLPNLNASMGTGGGGSRSLNAVDDFGVPIGGDEYISSRSSNASQNINGGLPLFNLGTIRSYGAAQADTRVQEAAAANQATVLRTIVMQAYYQTLRDMQLVEAEERNLQVARNQLQAIQKLLRVAARQPTDVLGAELQVAQAEQNLQQAQGAARKIRLQMKEQIGVDLDREFNLTSEFPAPFDPSELSVERLTDHALQNSPRLLQQVASVESAERQVGVARAARYPTISMGGSYGRGTSARGYDALGTIDLPNSSWGFSFSLSLPLFNRFGTAANIGRAEISENNARQTLRETQLALEREVRSAMIDLENAATNVQLAERAAVIAREQLRQGQEQYRVGSLDYNALQQMINQVAGQERQVINAYFQFATALLALEQRLGAPLAEVTGGG